MGLFKSSSSGRKAVGEELAAVLPGDPRPWYTQGHLLKLNFCILSLVMFSSANCYDGSMMNGLLALTQWHEFIAWFANRYGRKHGIWIGYFFLILATAAQSAAQNDITFVISRLFLGFASTWFATAVPLLITETAYPTQRGIASALFNCGWYVGSLVAAWATFATRNYPDSWSWRIPSILHAALPIVALPGFLLSTESPRWLVSRGMIDEAKKILANSHAGGDLSSPLVIFEMIEIETTLRAEQEAHASTSYADMVKTKGNRRRLFISLSLGIFAQWSGNGVVSYYLVMVLEAVGILGVTDQTLISGCLQVWNLIFAVAAAMAVDKVGRKTLFMASGITLLISYIIITGLSASFAQTGHSATGLAVIPFLFIYFAGYDIALNPLLVAYPCEIWPYRLRSRGLSVTYTATVLAIFFNIFINPIALESIGWRYYIVFIVVLVTMIITVWFWYPETRGHSLEQMAVLFDGEDAEIAVPADTAIRTASVVSVMTGAGGTGQRKSYADVEHIEVNPGKQ
ncbi:hypothetical protein H2201_008457 [Coniosporium apollinis]|uniref:Major facilitator superfamily (MFS) profile domain-containing protein n=1 Tax=Coniosporium apollinis TaxID=61459 RepID=A0ABQ9NGJ4_9PEZI|nr:hypothetical protein H2201_008457 [Coniosporium apollinis]